VKGQNKRRDGFVSESIVVSVATALAESSVGSLYDLVKRKFGGHKEAQVTCTWSPVRADLGGVVNQITGNVSGKVVQARDVEGGIGF
jgi:hypothetical protein